MNDDIFRDFDPDSNLLNDLLPPDLCKYYTTVEYCALNHDDKKCFSLLNYNIRSFNRNGNSFQAMLESLNKKFDCIVLSETWNNENNIDLCNIETYQSFHLYRPNDHVYSISGGVSIFCSSTLNATKNIPLSICNPNIETCVVDINRGNICLTVIGVYRPPQGCKKEFIGELSRIITTLDSNSKNRIVNILGDLNLNINDPNDDNVLDLSSMLYSKGFLSLINKPTRFPVGNSTGSPSTLDHIWTNGHNFLSAGIIEFDTTDHLPTFCNLLMPANDQTDKIKIETRPFSEEKMQNLINDIQLINWDYILDYNDPENCIIAFINKLNSLYCKHFPLKTKFISLKRLKNNWITSDVKHLINKKSENFKKLRRGDITREENNRQKNVLNSKIKKAKNDYYKNAFELHKKNMKKSWGLLKNLMGTKKSKSNISCLMKNNVELTNTRQIVEHFANFFSTVGSNLDQILRHTNLSPLAHINRNSHTFHLFPVTPEECIQIISQLKLTSTDKNHIPVKIFKSVSSYIVLPMVNIINASFFHGIFPKSMKLGQITPIYKKDDAKSCKNYRPISKLPFISKIIERCLSNRLVSFFNKFSLFSKHQYGFLKKRSTKDAIFDFLENIYDALDSKLHNISILIDLKSAFDTVNHDILLKKLDIYGIRGHALGLMKSYLMDREFSVGINNVISSKKTVNIGVPQGSILGPILFLIYINDLPLVSKTLSTTLYADDTNFSLNHRNYEEMIPLLNSELAKIQEWTLANRLTINPTKTEILLFSNRNIPPCNEQPSLNGNLINWVDSARFLGVLIDKKVNFKVHIAYVLNKISKNCGILYKIRDNLPLAARINFYNSFILPYLEFNILHWGGTNPTHITKLITCQKRALRTIASIDDRLTHTTPLFYRFKLLKFVDLYKFHCIMDTFFKINDGQYRVAHERHTRNSQLALPKFHRLSRTQQSITFSGPELFNSLPENIRNITSPSILKMKLKTYFIDQYA